MIPASAPMTLENQHWVILPEFDNKMTAQAVYASSPESAVEMARELFKGNDLGDVDHVNLDKIRIAEGTELPWNDPSSPAFIVEGSSRTMLSFASEEETRELYEYLYEGKPFTTRPATPAEKESAIRQNQLERDLEDEEQFNYGFNVLYKQEIEG